MTATGAPRVTRPRTVAVAAVLAALAALAAGLFAMSPAPVGVFWDDAVYVITAKALATGAGYSYIHLPDTPAATHYPPLWPAVLSLVWRIDPSFPDNVRLMKLINPVCLGAAAAAATMLTVRAARVPAWAAAVAAAGAVAVAPLLLLSATLMSEPLCLALSLAGLVAATVATTRGRVRDGLVAGALVGCAILARSAAIVLVPSLAVGLLWARSRRASLASLGVLALLTAPWFVWSSAHAAELPAALAGSYGPYTSWIIDAYRSDIGLLAEVVRQNTAAMFADTGVVLFGALPRFVRPPLVIALVVMLAAGLAVSRRRAAPIAMAVAAYTALVAIWPYPPGRFLWAFFPLYAAAMFVAAAALLRRLRGMRRAEGGMRRGAVVVRGAIVAFVGLVVAGVIRYDAVGFSRGWHRTAIDRNAESIVPVVGWIANNTAPGDTIATDVHLLAYLYAGRTAVPINMLTVAEHTRPKTNAAIRAEFAVIDSTFRPRWWIASGMVPERFALREWVAEGAAAPRPVADLPGGGIATRVMTR